MLPYFFDRAPSRLSCAEGGGCVTLIGSEAGKLSIRPSSSDFSSRCRLSASSRSFSVCFLFASNTSFSISVSFGIPMKRLHGAQHQSRPPFDARLSTHRRLLCSLVPSPGLGKPRIRLLRCPPGGQGRRSACGP